MSGGSRDYFYIKLEEQANLENADDINELIRDLSILFKSAEWYESCDESREDYLESLKEFRTKRIHPQITKNYKIQELNDKFDLIIKQLKE